MNLINKPEKFDSTTIQKRSRDPSHTDMQGKKTYLFSLI